MAWTADCSRAARRRAKYRTAQRETPNAYLMRACPLTDVEHTVEAVLPDAEAQDLLGLQASEPCLRVLRRTWSGKHLVSFARLLHPGAGYKLRSQTRVRK